MYEKFARGGKKMSIYDYEYNDIIKAQNIINSARAICDKKADDCKEDTIEFLKYNNMARNCTSTWILLSYYGDKIKDYQKIKNVRDFILDKLKNDYELNEYFDVEIVNEPCAIIFKVKNNPFSTIKQAIVITEHTIEIKDDISDLACDYQVGTEDFFVDGFTPEKANIISELSQMLLNFIGIDKEVQNE